MTRVSGSFRDGPLVAGLPRIAPPAEATVDIWFADLDLGEWPDDLEYLDDAEKARANRFAFPDHVRRFRRGRQMRRVILAAYLGLQPDRLVFAEEEHGRPYFDGLPRIKDLDFNMSNSQSLAILGVARGARIGLDLEIGRSMPDADPIAERNFHPLEAAAVKAESEDAAREDLFFRCWTRKEAVVKALGTGMQTDLQSFYVGNSRESGSFQARFETGADSRGPLWLTDISDSPNFASLASSMQPAQINIFRWCRSL